MALLATQARLREPAEFPGGIVAYHARHALRGSESDGDAASVRELCGRIGVAATEIEARVEPGPGLEARAREARYRAIRKAAGTGTLLLTAHHAGDQTETVILRILRGAGPVGLRGIHAFREDGIWRPLLRESRGNLEAVCAQAGWVPRQDSSNLDVSFARNLLRHRTIPSLEAEQPGFSSRIGALAEAAQRLEPYLERALRRLADSIQLRQDDRGFSIDVSGRPDPANDPELELLLDRIWTKIGRRPWSRAHRIRLLSDTASGATGRRTGGQGEQAIWGGKRLRIEKT